MKDLIIINSYTPDFEREGLLRNFVNEIDTTNYDVMVVSHSRLPDDLYKKVDYFIFDRENEVLTDIEFKHPMWWGCDEFNLETTEARRFNHFIAAYKLFVVGINAARNLGYKKAHIIEYDTSVVNMSHFDENSKLLDEYNVVFYKTDYTPEVISFPMSFNIKGIREEWFELDKEKVKSIHYKTIEDYELYLLHKEKKTFARDYRSLQNGSITINLYASYGDNTWLCPLVDLNDNLIFFAQNNSKETMRVDLLVNDHYRISIDLVPELWYTRLLGGYKEVTKLLVIKSEEEVIKYDFNTIDKELFKQKNYIRYV